MSIMHNVYLLQLEKGNYISIRVMQDCTQLKIATLKGLVHLKPILCNVHCAVCISMANYFLYCFTSEAEKKNCQILNTIFLCWWLVAPQMDTKQTFTGTFGVEGPPMKFYIAYYTDS